MAIVSIFQPTLQDAHEFLMTENIADEEFVQFIPEQTDAFKGLYVVLRVRAGKAADLKGRISNTIVDGYR